MAGTVVRVMPKRTLDFSAVASGYTQEVVIAQGLDLTAWREADLMVRVHSTSFPSSAIGNIKVYGYLEGRTQEDPGILFTNTTQLGLVTIDQSVAAGSYFVTNVGSASGSMVKILASGTRTGSWSATNAIKADVSIDLCLKSA